MTSRKTITIRSQNIRWSSNERWGNIRMLSFINIF